jgi:hypothetical protein
VSSDRVAADLLRFGEDCLSQGLLLDTPQTTPSIRRRTVRPHFLLTLRAWRWLVRCDAGLRRRGLAEIWAEAVERAPAASGAADPGRLQRALRAFSRAELLHISAMAPNDCLPRSLALFAFLRGVGVPVRHHIGFELDYGRAHAWVECDGNVIADSDRRAGLVELIA